MIHSGITKGGGSEPCALWAVEALKKDYDVCLISMGNINLEDLNHAYGTDIKQGDIEVITLAQRRFFKRRFDAFRNKLPRFCKKISSKFDLMISTYNVMDFGRRGMQIIADFNFDEELRKTYNRDKNFKKWIYRDSFLRRLYLHIAKCMSGVLEKNWKENLTISLSSWGRKILKDKFGMESIVLFPPVISNFPNVLWDERENGFIFIGRICPEKEVDKVIKIIKNVRESNINVHLHIIGRIDKRHTKYANFIKKLCAENNMWCFFEGEIYGQKKLNFIANHKYGISGRSNEPWGIAVAEMVKAGCIVFVPDGGGQTEIVEKEEVIYNNELDALSKIKAIIQDKNLQAEIRKHLSILSKKFSIENYCEGIRNAVQKFFAEK